MIDLLLFGIVFWAYGLMSGVLLGYVVFRLSMKAERWLLRKLYIVAPCPCEPCAHERRQYWARQYGATAKEAQRKLREAKQRYGFGLDAGRES